MIYIHTLTDEMVNYFCDDLLNFFPARLSSLKVSIVTFLEDEHDVEEKILRDLFVNSFYIGGLRRQKEEKINFNVPNFDSVFNFSYKNENRIPISSYDLICDANTVLTRNLLEVNEFIKSLKKYRMHRKYGKEFNLKYPFLWDMFINGEINNEYADYILNNSNYIAIPNIGVGGMGAFSINFIYKKNSPFLQTIENLIKSKNLNLHITSNIDDMPYF